LFELSRDTIEGRLEMIETVWSHHVDFGKDMCEAILWMIDKKMVFDPPLKRN